NSMCTDTVGKNFLAEIRRSRRVVQKLEESLPVEHVNAHTGQKLPAAILDAPTVEPFDRRANRLKLFLGFGLLDEPDNSAGLVHLRDAKARRLFLWNRENGDRHVREIVAVRVLQFPEIHAIELV